MREREGKETNVNANHTTRRLAQQTDRQRPPKQQFGFHVHHTHTHKNLNKNTANAHNTPCERTVTNFHRIWKIEENNGTNTTVMSTTQIEQKQKGIPLCNERPMIDL